MEFKKKEFKEKFYANLKLLAERFSYLPPALAMLNEKNITFGLFGGMEVWLLTSGRETNDVDILVDDSDFENVAAIFPNAEQAHKDYGDFVYLPNTDIGLSFNLTAHVEEKTYQLRLTDLVAQKREKFGIGNTHIYLINPVDTILLKSILQRGATEKKHDFEDIAHIVGKVKLDREYLEKRFEECGCDERVKRCLKSFNLMW
jgi:hypothetical protein